MSSPKHTTAEMLQATEKVLSLAQSMDGHDLALTALLSAYATIATNHPCCTEICGLMCKKLSDILLGAHASSSVTRH